MIENEGEKVGRDHIIIRGFIWQAKEFELYSGNKNLLKLESTINVYAFLKASSKVLYFTWITLSVYLLVFCNWQNIINWEIY